ncbi:MAG: nitronate monooxygenase family protein [Neomegalonema sp.]|nr:nitronate monooxygenase family protein [Neomegalonema sp.]
MLADREPPQTQDATLWRRYLATGLRVPVVAAPLFIISNPRSVIAQCKAGIIGSFPALNAREAPGEVIQLEAWLKEITEALDRHNQEHPDHPAAPFAVNQIVHRSNTRLERDVEICAKWRVPVWITSLGAREEVNQIAHEAGGVVLHDVINNRFARKAVEKGADGLIAVAAGAGGHAGALSPFALIQEIRAWFEGPLLLSGAIATGQSVLAAQAMGADAAYIGTAFIATEEARAQDAYKQMIVENSAADIVYSNYFTGVHGNYLAPSIRAQGLDPDRLPQSSPDAMDFSQALAQEPRDSSGESKPKAWKEIWGAGQGIGAVTSIGPASAVVARLSDEYSAARARLCSGEPAA